MVHSLPSGAARVVERAGSISACSAGSSVRAQHRSGTSLRSFACVLGQTVPSSVVSLQLVDVQWKLGMAVSSDTCRSLNSPYVCLLLKITEPSGHVAHTSFEMTIPQFQVRACCRQEVCCNFIPDQVFNIYHLFFCDSAEFSQAV